MKEFAVLKERDLVLEEVADDPSAGAFIRLQPDKARQSVGGRKPAARERIAHTCRMADGLRQLFEQTLLGAVIVG